VGALRRRPRSAGNPAAAARTITETRGFPRAPGGKVTRPCPSVRGRAPALRALAMRKTERSSPGSDRPRKTLRRVRVIAHLRSPSPPIRSTKSSELHGPPRGAPSPRIGAPARSRPPLEASRSAARSDRRRCDDEPSLQRARDSGDARCVALRRATVATSSSPLTCSTSSCDRRSHAREARSRLAHKSSDPAGTEPVGGELGPKPQGGTAVAGSRRTIVNRDGSAKN
jgi:hypothetical protein